MAIVRKFFDWSLPALESAGEFLIDKYRVGNSLALDKVIVVVPGSRAGRRLLEILVERAEHLTLLLEPPHIVTAGQLPETLYRPQRPFASDLVQKLAWVKALRALPRDRLLHVIPQPPRDDDPARWLLLGELVWRQHRELAADGLDFAHIIKTAWQPTEVAEQLRWDVLRQAQEIYLRTLDDLSLWDLQTARLFAVEHHECRTESDIVLIGTADMNGNTRQMLDQVADHVTALIFAPASLANRFDTHGCVQPAAWRDVTIDLRAEQIRVAEGPAEQAEEVARALASFAGRYRADEITIGVPDELLVPQIRRQLHQRGVPTRWVVGQRLAETGPYRFLVALADYADGQRFEPFAALLRHPDVETWLNRHSVSSESTVDRLTQLDEYLQQHLPPRLGKWLGPPEQTTAIRRAYELLQQLAAPLAAPPCSLADWSRPLAALLVDVYGAVELRRDIPADHFTLAACENIRDVLAVHQTIPRELAPTLTGWEALRIVLDELSAADIPPLPDPTAIELLGWLELPLDHAAALIVTSVNEPFVPTSLNSDLFLPNGLRQRLGLVDNARRYARDAYALSHLVASRPTATFIIGRRNSDGEPLTPSRLLFATNPTEVVRRAQQLFSPPLIKRHGAPADDLDDANATLRSQFIVPEPRRPIPPLERISVTAFRAYLACPYRFYLRYVLRLEPLNDQVEELDAPAFGNLLHDVLKRFGRSSFHDSTNAQQINDFLMKTLDEVVADEYGVEHRAPLTIQLAQVRSRLNSFAMWQAGWAEKGWRIKFTEVPDRAGTIRFPTNGPSLILDGRIDRIDHNEQTGEWVIFDYKSSDTAARPKDNHRRSDTWIDLQLPLYRHLARALGVEGNVQLGYIRLPKDSADVGESLAGWSADDLATADEVATEVVRNILDQKFWPPTEPPPDTLTEFAPICQDGTFDKQPPVVADETGEFG